MNKQLAEIVEDLEKALARVRSLAATHTNEEWVTRPAEGSWSAAECIAHLNLTSKAMVPLLERGLEEASRIGGGAPERLRRDALGWAIWRSVRPETRMRARTPASFVPAEAMDRELLVEEFVRLQEQQVNIVRAGDGLPIHRVKVPSPFAERARYSLYSAFTIVAAHQHRHLGQAERAVAQVSRGAKE